MPRDRTVIIVEDDFLIAEYLCTLCGELGASVVGMASEAEQALELITRHAPAHVLMDVRLGGDVDGVEIAEQLHKVLPETRIIFVTGSDEPFTRNRIAQDHPYRVLIKPISPAALKEALET